MGWQLEDTHPDALRAAFEAKYADWFRWCALQQRKEGDVVLSEKVARERAVKRWLDHQLLGYLELMERIDQADEAGQDSKTRTEDSLDPVFLINSARRNAQLKPLPKEKAVFVFFYDQEQQHYPRYASACGYHGFPEEGPKGHGKRMSLFRQYQKFNLSWAAENEIFTGFRTLRGVRHPTFRPRVPGKKALTDFKAAYPAEGLALEDAFPGWSSGVSCLTPLVLILIWSVYTFIQSSAGSPGCVR